MRIAGVHQIQPRMEWTDAAVASATFDEAAMSLEPHLANLKLLLCLFVSPYLEILVT